MLLAKSYSVSNQLILVFPLLLPVKSGLFELGILKETPGLHPSFYICILEHLYIFFWKFNNWSFSVRKGLHTLREKEQ